MMRLYERGELIREAEGLGKRQTIWQRCGPPEGNELPLRRTTEAMRRGLGRAVLELRARMRWAQADLAHHLNAQGGKVGFMLAPSQEVISRWENCEQAPSPPYRMALAKLAAKHGHEDLAELFRAPLIAWRLVGKVVELDERK